MKTYTKKPGIWHVSDFVAFGLCGVICLAFLVYGLTVGFTGQSSAVKQAPYILAVTAAGFFFVYWQVIRGRIKDLKGFVLVGNPEYGFMVNMGEYTPPDGLGELKDLVAETAEAWTKAFDKQEIQEALNRGYIWVWFKQGDLDLPFNLPGKVAGYTIYRRMVVGYPTPTTPIRRTAFVHELGHVIQGTVTGDWRQEIHHARSKKLGIR